MKQYIDFIKFGGDYLIKKEFDTYTVILQSGDIVKSKSLDEIKEIIYKEKNEVKING